MSPQGIMTRKKASYNPGLNPIKGHEFHPDAQTRTRDKLASLHLGVTKTSPLGLMLVDQPAIELHVFLLQAKSIPGPLVRSEGLCQ